jgi:hypothetical protein
MLVWKVPDGERAPERRTRNGKVKASTATQPWRDSLCEEIANATAQSAATPQLKKSKAAIDCLTTGTTILLPRGLDR